jgi:proteasome accessory factor C
MNERSGATERRRPAVRTTASDRVARLLAMIPWIAAHDGPTLDEICERFGIGRKKLEEDLAVVTLVGVPPYTPDTLIEVTIEGDRVWLRFADVFARPLHLTPEQGLALVAAGTASQGLPGTDRPGPLATALAKLARVLGVEPGEAVSVALGRTRPAVLEALRSAATAGRRVRLDYYAYGRDERGTRDVDPYTVFAHEGAWYMGGWCHQAGGERLFRVDRIYDVTVLDETFEPTSGDDSGGRRHGRGQGVFAPAADAPRVTIEVAPSAQWVIETYPIDQVTTTAAGWQRLRLAVTARPWLERLLVRLGPEARVVAADDPALVDAGRRAAARIVARYHAR